MGSNVLSIGADRRTMAAGFVLGGVDEHIDANLRAARPEPIDAPVLQHLNETNAGDCDQLVRQALGIRFEMEMRRFLKKADPGFNTGLGEDRIDQSRGFVFIGRLKHFSQPLAEAVHRLEVRLGQPLGAFHPAIG